MSGTTNTAPPQRETAGHAVASVVKACLKPSAGRAYRASARGVSRPNPLREDQRWRPAIAKAIRLAQPADQQRGNGNRATANRLERCTPLTSATRAGLARGPLLHPKSSLKENPAQ